MNLIDKHYQKLIQQDVPVKLIWGDAVAISSKLIPIGYTKNKQEKILSKSKQLDMYKSVCSYQPQNTAPVFVISSAGSDKNALKVAIDLCAKYVESNLSIKWHTLCGGFTSRKDIVHPNCDVLFISNVTNESTPHRLEALRDVIVMNHSCLRVIVTCNWDGIELARKVGIDINGTVWLGKM